MVLLEFSMSPLEKGASVGEYVTRSLKIIDESGLDYGPQVEESGLSGDGSRKRGDCWRRDCRSGDGVATRRAISASPRRGFGERSVGWIASNRAQFGRTAFGDLLQTWFTEGHQLQDRQ